MGKKRVRHHVNPLSDLSEYTFGGFGNDLPIIVDIGADRGEFTEGLLEKFGDTRNFLVLEIRRPLAERLTERFKDRSNVRVFSGDAVRNLWTLLEGSLEKDGASVETIYVNFPDPWFKDRHHKRRVMCKRLLDDVKTWISPQTRWVYQTDQKNLFDDTVSLLGEEGISDIQYIDDAPFGVRTKWEIEKMGQDLPIYRMIFYIS